MILIALFFFVTALISVSTVDEYNDFCRGVLFIVSVTIFCFIINYSSHPDTYHKILDIYWEETK